MRSRLALWRAPAGCFFIVAGWNWYHLAHRPAARFIIRSALMFAVLYVTYRIASYFLAWLIKRFNRHPFWQREFVAALDTLFLIGSLWFLVFFSRNEIVSLLYTGLVLVLFYVVAERFLRRHPAAEPWLAVNRRMFALAGFIFSVQAVLQYAAFYYYILDASHRFFNIVVFRSIAMTSFWLLGFALGSVLFFKFASPWRYVAVGLWSLLSIAALVLWSVNIGFLYFSGLYFSPVAIDHFHGSEGVAFNNVSYILAALLVAVLILYAIVLRDFIRAHALAPQRYWYFYQAVVAVFALGALLGLSSFKNSPERVIVKSFVDRYIRGVSHTVSLSPALQEKLARNFGLEYDLNRFAVSHHDTVFSTSTLALLPPRLKQNKPNIVILFLESFSARLSDVYNPAFPGITLGLKKMADNPHTTVIQNYYNSSTPTITGLISQLCSFLPPTGHEEIQNGRNLQRQYLLCLPDILRKRGGYGYAAYVTAVQKDFANKDTIFESMGTDEVFGTDELKKYISGPPLSWGYSDHQMFPFMWEQMRLQSKNKDPFLLMLSTVDTHPPFNLAKDMVRYGNGKNNLLNSVRTTDDAFNIFWDQFIASDFANNTIVVAVADHAVFPAAFTKETFPAEAGKLNYYDQTFFQIYIPDSVLPKQVNLFSSGLDFTPTLLHILGINSPNSFEGHSLFDDRARFPNVLGMHELGLYINQQEAGGKRSVSYDVPGSLECGSAGAVSSTQPLSLCEFLNFYRWKRQMLEEGRLWEKAPN